MGVAIDRQEFGVRQAEMTARWYENVKRTHGDVAAYIGKRQAAYLDRWSEAARFIPDGARVLDIGGGNLFASLIAFFKQRRFVYSFLDVDPMCVAGSRALAETLGLQGASFAHGFNDSLYPADASIDAVFSSHCLEHSIDLVKTLNEVNRVLTPGGMLLMAVPFGWEMNPEHPYFFDPEDWISLVMDAGFRIRVAQIGSEYPEIGHDYFIAAEKVADVGRFRLDPRAHNKVSYQFIACHDDRIRYEGLRQVCDDYVIMKADDWRISIDVPSSAREVLPVMSRHDWSGIVEGSFGQRRTQCDLYSWFDYTQPFRIAREPGDPTELTLRCVGASPMSRSREGILHGIMIDVGDAER